MKKKYFALLYQNEELRIVQDCLDKYFIISSINDTEYKLILPLKASPRCYIPSQQRGTFDQRILRFGNIDESCLADSSALCLCFHNQSILLECAKMLTDVFKLDCHQGLISSSKMPSQPQQLDNILSDFWSNYALQIFMSLGYRIKRRISPVTISKMTQLSTSSKGEPYSQHPCYLKLVAVYYRARQNRFFDINEEFDHIQPMPSSILLPHWEYVPRIYLTPYGIYPLPIKPMRGNRILRERKLFGPSENFCRVIIRDVDMGQPQQDFMKIIEQWIKDLIVGKQNITVGGQSFQFLLCSNSQLRDRSFWFHTTFAGRTAEHIRVWMGDFSHEKCVGTRIARMALSLTGTTATIRLQPNQMQRIQDKFDCCERNFTDGIGKISPLALREALITYNPELIEDDYMPCLIQARLNGIKGVFVLAPDLEHRGVLIQYRPSQYKFHVNHNVLEIVKHGVSGPAFLNRQVIVLLENMGVKEHIFLKLQNKSRMKISMSIIANQSAQRVLEQHVRMYDWDRMRKSGVQITREPFVRSLLLLLAQERLRKLKEKSHVHISSSDGRMLIGTVDETNSLRYGQVFIQLRNLNNVKQVVKNRKVLVTKNPAHFPGDIRKLDAVDCPALHHLSECIVFPACGPRPHSNEISGSDLDGDEYWVCWNEDLTNNATIQHAAADFDSAGKKSYPGDITMDVIAEFLFQYLSSDALGVLSNRHLACCAQYGPGHPHSCQLAKVISEAVDFPKTGILPKIPKNIKLTMYPDYMENKTKESFVSESSLGSMYRQIKEVWKIHSTWQLSLEEEIVHPDTKFLLNGYERYIKKAENEYQYYSSRISNILAVYNLEKEYELITGCHSAPEEEKKNNDSVETASLEFRYLISEMRDRFDADNLNYRDKLHKASAWYYVAYNAGTTLSFGWIMDRLMSDIIQQKQLPQEEHTALRRIGQAIYNSNNIQFTRAINFLAASFNLNDEQSQLFSDAEKVGYQFLKIIEQSNETAASLVQADQFLTFLHRVALNIL